MAGFEEGLKRQTARHANDRDGEREAHRRVEASVAVVCGLLKDCADHLSSRFPVAQSGLRKFKGRQTKRQPAGFVLSSDRGMYLLTPDGQLWNSEYGYQVVSAESLSIFRGARPECV